MPQLDAASYLPQVFCVIIRFYLLYVRVAHAILPLLGRILWARELKRTQAGAQMDGASAVEAQLTAQREEVVASLPFAAEAQKLADAEAKAKTNALARAWGTK